MPPHTVSMDSNLLMNPYRDAALWQRSAIIPGHVLLHQRLVRVDRAAALRFGAQCAAPLACAGETRKVSGTKMFFPAVRKHVLGNSGWGIAQGCCS
jgi:hypothetical protein